MELNYPPVLIEQDGKEMTQMHHIEDHEKIACAACEIDRLRRELSEYDIEHAEQRLVERVDQLMAELIELRDQLSAFRMKESET